MAPRSSRGPKEHTNESKDPAKGVVFGIPQVLCVSTGMQDPRVYVVFGLLVVVAWIYAS